MRNEATLWLAKYMEDHGISTKKISRENCLRKIPLRRCCDMFCIDTYP